MKKPEWLKIKVSSNEAYSEIESTLNRLSLNTVCEEASCPNRFECFGRKTATFIMMGRSCTRNCTFCNVTKSMPQPLDADEPIHIAQAVKELNLHFVVITSVTRDDLADGGAAHFVKVINEIRNVSDTTAVEVLIPDFNGNVDALAAVVRAKPEIIGHNIETVPRLYPQLRSQANYERSLRLLRNVKSLDNKIRTKSSIMLGLGETTQELLDALKELRTVDCDLLTLGQYLAPSKNHHPVIEYIHPDVFDKYKHLGLELGFKHVEAGPFVRSSYRADRVLNRDPALIHTAKETAR